MAFSHMRFMGGIADTLTEAGHEVTLIQPLENPLFTSPGCKKTPVYEIRIHDHVFEKMKEFKMEDYMARLVWEDNLHPFEVKSGSEAWNPSLKLFIEDLMANKTMLEDLKSYKFDVGITELFDFSAFPIFHEIGVKTIIGAHTTTLMEGTALAMAVPVLPSYLPPSLGLRDSGNSFMERLRTMGQTYYALLSQKDFAEPTESYMTKHYPHLPNLWEIVSEIPLVFTNSVPVLDFPRPIPESIINVGGITMEPSQPLTKEWNDMLNLRPQTVLFSFGSIFPPSTMKIAVKENIVKVFKKFPNTTFIWKYEPGIDNELFKDAPNIIRTQWMPQNDLLGDSRISLFISHGGAGSLQESAFNGVPMIMVPLFGDQFRNAFVASYREYAIRLRKEELGIENALEHALKEILTNPKYSKAAQKLKRQIARYPFTPKEKIIGALKMFENVEDIPDFRLQGRKISYVQYYNLDILAVSSIFMMLIIYAPIYLFKKLCVLSIAKVKTN